MVKSIVKSLVQSVDMGTASPVSGPVPGVLWEVLPGQDREYPQDRSTPPRTGRNRTPPPSGKDMSRASRLLQSRRRTFLYFEMLTFST